jgi:hypothetical protein
MLLLLAMLSFTLTTSDNLMDAIFDNAEKDAELVKKQREDEEKANTEAGFETNLFYQIATDVNKDARKSGKHFYQDKTTSHRYHEIYGQFVMPFRRKRRRADIATKFLEIGLGCDKGIHYGAGIEIWKSVFHTGATPPDSLWVAEIDEDCVKQAQGNGTLDSVGALIGNQMDVKDLQRWKNESGGNFDIIIDDGSHWTQAIYTSFYYLFTDALAPGGLYIIEDMQVNGFQPFVDPVSGKTIVLAELLSGWIQQLLLGKVYDHDKITKSTNVNKGQAMDVFRKRTDRPQEQEQKLQGYASNDQYFSGLHIPLPPGVKMISCIHEACIIHKCMQDDSAFCTR